MQAILKRDEYDCDMFHVYSKRKVGTGTSSVTYHLFSIHVDTINIFGKQFAKQVMDLNFGEEMDVQLEAEVMD